MYCIDVDPYRERNQSRQEQLCDTRLSCPKSSPSGTRWLLRAGFLACKSYFPPCTHPHLIISHPCCSLSLSLPSPAHHPLGPARPTHGHHPTKLDVGRVSLARWVQSHLSCIFLPLLISSFFHCHSVWNGDEHVLYIACWQVTTDAGRLFAQASDLILLRHGRRPHRVVKPSWLEDLVDGADIHPISWP